MPLYLHPDGGKLLRTASGLAGDVACCCCSCDSLTDCLAGHDVEIVISGATGGFANCCTALNDTVITTNADIRTYAGCSYGRGWPETGLDELIQYNTGSCGGHTNQFLKWRITLNTTTCEVTIDVVIKWGGGSVPGHNFQLVDSWEPTGLCSGSAIDIPWISEHLTPPCDGSLVTVTFQLT